MSRQPGDRDVEGLGFRVQGLGFGVWGLGLRARGLVGPDAPLRGIVADELCYFCKKKTGREGESVRRWRNTGERGVINSH